MKKVLILLIFSLFIFGCPENRTNGNDLNSDLNNGDTNGFDTNSHIDFSVPPEERMKEKLMENQEEIWSGEFPEEDFELGECKGKTIFIGEGIINIGGGWNQEVNYYNFLECSEEFSLEELAELRSEETAGLEGEILDKNVSVEKEFFEGKEILVKRIEVGIVGIKPHEKMYYTDRYEYRFYNCEGIILEGISRIFGNDDWEPRKPAFIEVFNEMISVCR